MGWPGRSGRLRRCRCPRLTRRLAGHLALVTSVLLLGACGGEGAGDGLATAEAVDSSSSVEQDSTEQDSTGQGLSEEEAAEQDSGEPEADTPTTGGSLADLTLGVGAKNYGEQLILGNLVLLALEDAGVTIDGAVNAGTSEDTRQALVDGDIDLYWEYNNTAWVNFLGESLSFAPGLTEQVAEADLDRNGIRWLGAGSFSNSYGIVAAEGRTEEALDDLAAALLASDPPTVCVDEEFVARPDGLSRFATEFGVAPDADGFLVGATSEAIFTGLEDGTCDFGNVNTTDGRTASFRLLAGDDVFAPYNVSLTLREEIYAEAPTEFDALVEVIVAALDQETMVELNRRVDVDGERPIDVAREFLDTLELGT